MKELLVILALSGLVLLITIISLCRDSPPVSEAVFAITAVIILWYTCETSKISTANSIIAEANKELMQRSLRPIAGVEVCVNEKDPNDTLIKVINLSEHAIAVQLNLNIKMNGEIIKNSSPAYDGSEFWNLQYKETKIGHFSWLDFFVEKKLVSREEYQEMRNWYGNGIREKVFERLTLTFETFSESNLPRLSMDIEIYCTNDRGQSTYYPPVHYDYKPFRMVWVPVATTPKPFWEYDSKPLWVI